MMTSSCLSQPKIGLYRVLSFPWRGPCRKRVCTARDVFYVSYVSADSTSRHIQYEALDLYPFSNCCVRCCLQLSRERHVYGLHDLSSWLEDCRQHLI